MLHIEIHLGTTACELLWVDKGGAVLHEVTQAALDY